MRKLSNITFRRQENRSAFKMIFDNSGQSAVVDGYSLMTQGVTVRLEGALTSELLIFEALTD